MKANQEIRQAIENNRLKYYEVEEAVGISDSHFSVWLRRELTTERKQMVMKAIESLANKESEG